MTDNVSREWPVFYTYDSKRWRVTKFVYITWLYDGSTCNQCDVSVGFESEQEVAPAVVTVILCVVVYVRQVKFAVMHSSYMPVSPLVICVESI
jgi:uncharacterized protein (DUF983 family)